MAASRSVSPYLLLTLLEYKSHWVTGNPTNMAETEYPMGMVKLEYRGLYKQLSWAVQQLSIGYYGWRAGTLNSLTFKDGSTVRISPGLNAGTAAIQYLFSRWYNQAEWAAAIYGSDSMPDLMSRMFGDLWARARAVDPLYPADLQQPDFRLPFYSGRVWSYTGGPHSAWGEDGALAAYFGGYSREKAIGLKARHFDRTVISQRGLKYERLDQLTVDLLLGARG